MAFLSEPEQARVRDAVRRAEEATSGEFVTVIASASDGYRYVPTLWAALIALSIPGVGLLIGVPFESLYALQIAAFLVLAPILRWTPVKMRLIPRDAARRRAALFTASGPVPDGAPSRKGLRAGSNPLLCFPQGPRGNRGIACRAPRGQLGRRPARRDLPGTGGAGPIGCCCCGRRESGLFRTRDDPRGGGRGSVHPSGGRRLRVENRSCPS